MPEPLALTGPTRAFIAAPGRFATLATLAPDGAPRQAVVWYRLDPDGMLVINSAEGRHWPANLRRDARVAIAIADPGCLLYTSPSPRDGLLSRMPSSA